MNRALATAALAAGFAAAAAAQDQAKDPEAAIRLLAQQVGEIAGKQQGVLDRLELLKRRVRLDELMLGRIQQRQEETRRAVQEAEERAKKLEDREAAARR